MNISICSAKEAIDRTNETPNYWHVMSISTPEDRWPNLPNAAFVKQFSFYDVDKTFTRLDDTLIEPPSLENVRDLLSTGREIGNNPLMIHCYAGISRSTATAMIILLERFYGSTFAVDLAVDTVYEARPFMYPNKHLLGLGIQEIGRQKNDENYEMLTWRKLYNNNVWKQILGL